MFGRKNSKITILPEDYLITRRLKAVCTYILFDFKKTHSLTFEGPHVTASHHESPPSVPDLHPLFILMSELLHKSFCFIKVYYEFKPTHTVCVHKYKM